MFQQSRINSHASFELLLSQVSSSSMSSSRSSDTDMICIASQQQLEEEDDNTLLEHFFPSAFVDFSLHGDRITPPSISSIDENSSCSILADLLSTLCTKAIDNNHNISVLIKSFIIICFTVIMILIVSLYYIQDNASNIISDTLMKSSISLYSYGVALVILQELALKRRFFEKKDTFIQSIMAALISSSSCTTTKTPDCGERHDINTTTTDQEQTRKTSKEVLTKKVAAVTILHEGVDVSNQWGFFADFGD